MTNILWKNLTTNILYNCKGVDVDSGNCFHCWVTDRTIPLDELCRDDCAIRDRCSLAAFCCILKAALHGLYLSDCHFFNFGVQLTENATEHLVVIIDAGSRGIERRTHWNKSQVNQTVMRKFWAHCAEENAQNPEIEQMWRSAWNIEECYEKASKAWQSWPFLTTDKVSTSAVWQAMLAEELSRRSIATGDRSLFKIMELVGMFTAVGQWNGKCAVECFKAARSLDSELFVQEDSILTQLYSRIQYARTEDEESHDVMVFWGRLNDYRERNVACYRAAGSSGEPSLTPEQAREMVENFKYYELWKDLTWKQRQSKHWRSTVNTILHKRAGWTHAAKAIMQYGLPRLEQPVQPEDATEQIKRLGEFARDMAQWLINFAKDMHTYMQTPGYEKNYQASMVALKRRCPDVDESI